MNVRMAIGFIVTVVLSLAGQSLLRIGAKNVMAGATPALGEFFSRIPQMIMSPHIVGGIVLCGLGALSWIYILSQYEISRALPILGALAYIGIFVIGRVVLKEQTSWANLAGILLICAGLYLVTLKSA